VALVVLTDNCSLSCQACFRPREPKQGATPWSFTELESCLNELVGAGQSSVSYTGGEPSLWRDGERTFTDLLVTSSRLGLSVMFVTNGHPFRDYDSARALLDRYFELTHAPLHVVVSVDRWHDDTWVEGRSRALESLSRWLRANADTNVFEVEVASLWCLDDSCNIPLEEFARYTEAGVRISYVPLSPIGRAHSLSELAPTLSAHRTCKASLGSHLVRSRESFDARSVCSSSLRQGSGWQAGSRLFRTRGCGSGTK
jgi:MoaA/NifB/PqqE/SkfB family radical SAM enzyme